LDDERVDPSFAIHERKQYIAYNAVNMDQTKLGGSAKFRSCEIRSKKIHKLKQLSQSRGTLEDLKKPKRQRQSRRRHRLHCIFVIRLIFHVASVPVKTSIEEKPEKKKSRQVS